MLLHCTIRQRILEHAWWRTSRATARAPSRGGASPRLPLRLYKHHDRGETLTRTPVPGADQPRWDSYPKQRRPGTSGNFHLFPSFTDFREREPWPKRPLQIKQWDPGYCGCPFCWSSWPTEASPVLTSTTVVSYDSFLIACWSRIRYSKDNVKISKTKIWTMYGQMLQKFKTSSNICTTVFQRFALSRCIRSNYNCYVN